MITRSDIRKKEGKRFSPVKIRAISTETGDWFEYESINKAGKDLIIHSGSISWILKGLHETS